MRIEKSVSVQRERSFSAHHMLLAAAEDVLTEARINEPYSPLIAIAISALAIDFLCKIFNCIIPISKFYKSW